MKMKNISLKLILSTIIMVFIHSCGELENQASYTSTDIVVNQNSYIIDNNTRFSRDEINHLVVDNSNKIVWQDNEDVIKQPKTFQKAQAYCNSLKTLNLNWRLPTIKELSSIIDDSSQNSNTNMIFDYTRGVFYISSSKLLDDSSSMWGVHFKVGFKIWMKGNRKSYSRCVANL